MAATAMATAAVVTMAMVAATMALVVTTTTMVIIVDCYCGCATWLPRQFLPLSAVMPRAIVAVASPGGPLWRTNLIHMRAYVVARCS